MTALTTEGQKVDSVLPEALPSDFAGLASYDSVVLVVVNLSEQNFTDHSYGVRTGAHFGQWSQILCTQDAAFGGWDGAGNAFYEPWTQADGQVYVNLPKWSVVMLRRK